MEKIVMNEGVASQFKGHLQSIYDYFNECYDAVNDCKMLDALGIENNNAQLKIEIYNQKNDINKLLDSVSIYEEKLMDQDSSYAKVLDDVVEEDTDTSATHSDTKTASPKSPSDDTSVETIDQTIQTDDKDKETSVKQNNDSTVSDDSTIDTISQTSEPKDNTTSTTSTSTTSSSNHSSNTNTNSYTNQSNVYNESTTNNTNQNYYEFSTNISDMQKAGDIFANSTHSLTYYTNFLLYKYNINDKEIAEKIYQALLDYGKAYYESHNGENPILKLDEQLIITGIYNIMKDQENFDISKYPIFQNIQIN